MAPVGGISYIACWPACLFYMIILMQLRLLVMGRKTKRTCGWWRDDGVSARNISELNGYRRRDGGKTKRFKSLHAFILD